MSEPALMRVQGVTKAYTMGQRRLEVLHGVDMVVRKGELLSIRGPSGAGKSTLLHVMGLLDVPDGGRVLLDDVCVFDLPERERARLRATRMGFVFQFYHLLRDLDAVENVCLARMVRDSSRRYRKREARERAKAMLERVGLADRLRHRPPQLSGGERQRVAIARALMNEPELVLCDEPTGNLDHRTAEGILELLWELKEESASSFVIVTHDTGLAARADREVVLSDGRVETVNG
jgi:lipoprotein-releasing system ATP-binding protein